MPQHNERDRRNREITNAALDGAAPKDLAKLYGITAGRVNTIIRRELRQRGLAPNRRKHVLGLEGSLPLTPTEPVP